MDGSDEIPCIFCEVAASRMPARDAVENTVIFESRNILLLPALGPLLLGHALAVPRMHSRGRLTEPVSGEQRHREFIAWLRAKTNAAGIPLLEVEHGMAASQALGPCIVHTHTHLFPADSLTVDDFTGWLPPRRQDDVEAYVRASDGSQTALLDATGLPGQGTRRLIATKLGIEDWDWGLAPKFDMVQQTIEFWRRLI